MAAIPWTKLHGASTHFPIVLTFAAFLCDFSSVVLWPRPIARGSQVAGLCAIVFAAAGSMAAVFSGLFLTRGEFWGAADLGRHHRYVWPALALIVGAATWRWSVRNGLTRPSYAAYLAVVLASLVLVGLAGNSGGEMLQAAP